MNKSTRLILVLTAIAAIAGVMLAYFDSITKPQIAAHQEAKLNSAIAAVLPGAVTTEAILTKTETLYLGRDAQGKLIGVAFTSQGSGYQDRISLLVGVDPSFSKILALKVTDQKETPGLGTKIEEDPSQRDNPTWFQKQFSNLDLEAKLNLVKHQEPSQPGEVEAISGATISSQAVVTILQTGLKRAQALCRQRKECQNDH